MDTSGRCLAVAFSQLKVRGGVFRASRRWLFAHHAAHLRNSSPQDTADAPKFVWIQKAVEKPHTHTHTQKNPKTTKKTPSQPLPKKTQTNKTQ